MRATDIIRQVLNMIDAIDTNAAQGKIDAVQNPEVSVEIVGTTSGEDDELNRMRQIAGLLSPPNTQYTTEPNERIASIDAVTTDAGGGVNGPKNPSDIRANSVSMYPNYQDPGV